MMPQASFLYAAPLKAGSEPALRTLLRGMNVSPGIVDPQNSLLPFARLPQLHFARLLIVNEPTKADRAVFGMTVEGLPDYLVFMGEIDGDEGAFRDDLIAQAGNGLRSLFQHCVAFGPDTDLNEFLQQSRVKSAANYVNWVGRTTVQVREEEALRRSLELFLSERYAELRSLNAGAIRSRLQRFVREQQQKGRLTLTPRAADSARMACGRTFFIS